MNEYKSDGVCGGAYEVRKSVQSMKDYWTVAI